MGQSAHTYTMLADAGFNTVSIALCVTIISNNSESWRYLICQWRRRWDYCMLQFHQREIKVIFAKHRKPTIHTTLYEKKLSKNNYSHTPNRNIDSWTDKLTLWKISRQVSLFIVRASFTSTNFQTSSHTHVQRNIHLTHISSEVHSARPDRND